MSKEYIEREALLDQDFTYKCINIDDISVVEKLIKNVPAADVAPVVHGKWIPIRTETFIYVEKCSECSYVEEYNINPDKGISPNFCPNCGAKMDGRMKNV